MKRGYLSEYFEGVAAKKLSAVEINPAISNQHEFQAISTMREFLGSPDEKTTFPTDFIYLDDDLPTPVQESASLTLYNCRAGKARSPEYRLYFTTTEASRMAGEGDLLVIAKKRDTGLLVIIAKNGSGIERQIEWLFGLSDKVSHKFSVNSDLETERDRVEFTSRHILESIGVSVDIFEEIYLDDMISRFRGKFPTTREFSGYARSTLKNLSPHDTPDLVLMAWMEREEVLFRTFERHLISDRLSQGFTETSGSKGVDVDGFLSFSLSVQNRRKSRVGLAFENHLEHLFVENGIKHTRTAKTENKSRPDFLFPGEQKYHDPAFNPLNLTMLGVKTTCKDRWRQVLAEADRIENKHLLTLEAAISVHQTDEMAAKGLQLVLPRGLHGSYTPQQQAWLMDVADFTDMVRNRQSG